MNSYDYEKIDGYYEQFKSESMELLSRAEKELERFNEATNPDREVESKSYCQTMLDALSQIEDRLPLSAYKDDEQELSGEFDGMLESDIGRVEQQEQEPGEEIPEQPAEPAAAQSDELSSAVNEFIARAEPADPDQAEVKSIDWPTFTIKKG